MKFIDSKDRIKFEKLDVGVRTDVFFFFLFADERLDKLRMFGKFFVFS